MMYVIYDGLAPVSTSSVTMVVVHGPHKLDTIVHANVRLPGVQPALRKRPFFPACSRVAGAEPRAPSSPNVVRAEYARAMRARWLR